MDELIFLEYYEGKEVLKIDITQLNILMKTNLLNFIELERKQH